LFLLRVDLDAEVVKRNKVAEIHVRDERRGIDGGPALLHTPTPYMRSLSTSRQHAPAPKADVKRTVEKIWETDCLRSPRRLP
jgi:hypothetical protein